MQQKIYFDKWAIGNQLGKGGQGTTFEAYDINETSGTKYALKKLNFDDLDDSHSIEKKKRRFENEIKAVKLFNHPNIVKLVDFNLETDDPYMVSEFCEGGELTFEKISKLSNVEKLTLFSSICGAIGYAHKNDPQIIHRDIKPANILLKKDKKTPAVADFGICLNTQDGLERLTSILESVGPKKFIAPELADGKADEVTPSSDVYSLGKLLYWMFAGKVMNRENFSNAPWDLRSKKNPDHTFHFLYEIFEDSIVEDPQKRYSDANVLKKVVDEFIEYIKYDARYLDKTISQRCVFCKEGFYTKFEDPVMEGTYPDQTLNYKSSRKFGFYYKDAKSESNYFDGRFAEVAEKQDYPKILYMECTNCGNLQIFRLNKTNWK